MPGRAWAIQVKIEIIEADPTEQGLRASLNLGHTVGHGLESASDYSMSHGEAVAVGMIAEARLAEALGLAEVGISARIAAVFRRLGLATSYCGPSPKEVREAMDSDKKRQAGRLRFSLPAAIGEIRPGVEVPEKPLMQILESLEYCP